MSIIAVVALALTAQVARAVDLDLPMPPIVDDGQHNGPPCMDANGHIQCLHGWGSSVTGNHALAVFFEQKVCLGADLQPVHNVSPFDNNAACVRLGYLHAGDPLPYHKTTEEGDFFDDIPVLTSPGIGQVAVEMRCTQGVRGTCDDTGAPGEDLANTDVDVWLQSPKNIVEAKNGDENGPGLHVNQDCETSLNHQVTAAALADTRVWLDVSASVAGRTDGSGNNPRQFAAINDDQCPNYDQAYGPQSDAWFFAMDKYPLDLANSAFTKMSIPLLTLVHTDTLFGGDIPGDNCHLEQEYLTREMGKVRHESFNNTDCGGNPPPAHIDEDCKQNASLEYALENPNGRVPGHWNLYGCQAFMRGQPTLGSTSDASTPAKASQILAASNLTSSLFGPQGWSDSPAITSIQTGPSPVVYGQPVHITLKGNFAPNTYFSTKAKVMNAASRGYKDDLNSQPDQAQTQKIEFDYPGADYTWDTDKLKLQCGENPLRVYDGVSTTHAVVLNVQC